MFTESGPGTRREERRTDEKSAPACPTLILGLGNILLGDEGVGVRVVEAMADGPLPRGVETFDGATAGLDLLDVIADRERVVVIDAIEGQLEPGTVLRLRPRDLMPGEGHGLSLHEVGLLETLRVSEHAGCAPAEVVIFGVQPKQTDWSLELSSEVSAVVPKIVELVLGEVTRR